MIAKQELRQLAGSIVTFRTWKNRRGDRICACLFGSKVQVSTYALDGDESIVLSDMANKFWATDKIHLN